MMNSKGIERSNIESMTWKKEMEKFEWRNTSPKDLEDNEWTYLSQCD